MSHVRHFDYVSEPLLSEPRPSQPVPSALADGCIISRVADTAARQAKLAGPPCTINMHLVPARLSPLCHTTRPLFRSMLSMLARSRAMLSTAT